MRPFLLVTAYLAFVMAHAPRVLACDATPDKGNYIVNVDLGNVPGQPAWENVVGLVVYVTNPSTNGPAPGVNYTVDVKSMAGGGVWMNCGDIVGHSRNGNFRPDQPCLIPSPIPNGGAPLDAGRTDQFAVNIANFPLTTLVQLEIAYVASGLSDALQVEVVFVVEQSGAPVNVTHEFVPRVQCN